MPKYRADIAGNIKGVMEDCVALMRGELRDADFFMAEAADCESAMREYGDYLTAAELARCFERAKSTKAPA